MSNINDGGPAFPAEIEWQNQYGSGIEKHQGMTLRDYFAGQALVGLLAQPPAEPEFGAHYFAMSSYLTADAMLTAREVRP